MGLVSPQAIPFVLRHDLVGAFRAAPTDFVVFHTRGRMGEVIHDRWFRRRYRPLVTLREPSSGTGELVIYGRRGGADSALEGLGRPRRSVGSAGNLERPL
jgi:hypothetical protein